MHGSNLKNNNSKLSKHLFFIKIIISNKYFIIFSFQRMKYK